MARLEARFRLLPWPLARVQRIWHLFGFMDVPRRIARERIPTVAGGAAPSYHFYGAYQRLNSNQKQGPFRQSFFGTFLTQESPSIKDAQILNQLLPAEECEAPIH